jgi:hypothetical protein
MNWWNRLRHREKLEEQLQKELHFHLDEHAAFPQAKPGGRHVSGSAAPSK